MKHIAILLAVGALAMPALAHASPSIDHQAAIAQPDALCSPQPWNDTAEHIALFAVADAPSMVAVDFYDAAPAAYEPRHAVCASRLVLLRTKVGIIYSIQPRWGYERASSRVVRQSQIMRSFIEDPPIV